MSESQLSVVTVSRGERVDSDADRSDGWQSYLLPGILLMQALFVGTTFRTASATLALMVLGGLVVALATQWANRKRQRRREAIDAAGEGRRPNAVRRRATPSNVTSSTAKPSTAKPSTVTSRTAKPSTVKLSTATTLGFPSKIRRGHRFWRIFLVLAVLSVIFVAVAWRVGHHMSGNLNPVAMIVDAIGHAAFVMSLLLWCFYPRKGHPAMLFAGVILVLTTVTAGGVSHSINGQVVAMLALVIAFTLASRLILSRWQVDSAAWARRRSRSRRGGLPAADPNSSVRLPISTVTYSEDTGRSGLLFSVLALSILLTATSAAGQFAARIMPDLQLDFFDRLSQSLESVTSNSIIGGTRYVRGSRLGSVRRHMLGDPAEIALRAYAESEPGYLRGTVFDMYRRARWGEATPQKFPRGVDTSSIARRDVQSLEPGTVKLKSRASRSLERFLIRSGNETEFVGTVEVHNVPTKGQIVFSALTTQWVEASTYGATITHHHMVEGGVDVASPYVLGIGESTPREQLSPLRKDLLLSLPETVRKEVGPIAESICEGKLTARSKAAAIESHFQDNFRYSLRFTATPKNVDPLLHFLRTQHPAHCEYFASAAAVMLRSVGVPTRYVTGYVVREQSDDDAYWIARNRDAHAWVEAYDDITERWFAVEATVGRSYRTLSNQSSTVADDTTLNTALNESDDDQSLLNRILGWLFSIRAAESLTVLFRFAQLPLLCLVVVLLWVRHRQKVRAGGDPMDYRSRQMLQGVDRRLRRYSLVRDSSETLHQFAGRIETTAQNSKSEVAPFLNTAADWYRSFAADRYRGVMPKPLQSG